MTDFNLKYPRHKIRLHQLQNHSSSTWRGEEAVKACLMMDKPIHHTGTSLVFAYLGYDKNTATKLV